MIDKSRRDDSYVDIGEVLFYFLMACILFSAGYSFFSDGNQLIDQNKDVAVYVQLVVAPHEVDWSDHRSTRFLIPFLATGVYEIVRGGLGTWSEARFSLFCVDALFILCSIFCYQRLFSIYRFDKHIFRVAGLIFVSSFATVNHMVEGLVDAGELFFCAVLMLCLTLKKHHFIPLIFVFGVLNRETFLAVGMAIIASEILYRVSTNDRKLLITSMLTLSASFIFGFVTFIILKGTLTGSYVTPIAAFNSFNELPEWGEASSISKELRRFMYVFLPIVVVGGWTVLKLPKQLLFHLSGAVLAILFGGYIASTSGTGLSRYLFSTIGFATSLLMAQIIMNGYNRERTGF